MAWGRATQAFLILVMVVLTIHGIAWWLVTERLIAEAEVRVAAERAAGASISHAPAERGGYPLEARVTLPGLRYAGAVRASGGAQFPFAATTGSLTLVLAPAAPRLLLADIACPCTVASGPGEATPVDARSLRAELPLGPGTPTLTGTDLTLGLSEGPVTIALLRAQLPEPAAARVSAEAFGIVLPPPDARWPLGQRIATLTAEARLRGVLPAQASPARALAAWRDADGALILEGVSLAWGPLTLRGAATVTLDAALQPRGAARAELAGFGATLDRLAAAGVIARGPASLARFALTAASRPGEGGGERVVDIPLALEGGTLTAARIPIARLPHIAWPDDPR
jgi:hypothetical protein